MSVAAPRAHLLPSVLLKQTDDLAHLHGHGGIVSCIPRSNCRNLAPQPELDGIGNNALDARTALGALCRYATCRQKAYMNHGDTEARWGRTSYELSG